jgi:hypothetical protein
MQVKSLVKHPKIQSVEFAIVGSNKLRGFSPQANYTYRATAACQWS